LPVPHPASKTRKPGAISAAIWLTNVAITRLRARNQKWRSSIAESDAKQGLSEMLCAVVFEEESTKSYTSELSDCGNDLFLFAFTDAVVEGQT